MKTNPYQEFEDAIELRAGWYQHLCRSWLLVHRYTDMFLPLCQQVYGASTAELNRQSGDRLSTRQGRSING